MSTLANRNTLRAALLIEGCIQKGIKTFAIAPGSRSTPLTLAAAEHPEAKTLVHFDERGLAFWALGAAKAKQDPVAIITTSGTAVANCLPAICEAQLTHVPLLVLSADRPDELHGIGANQTMSQKGLFGEHVKADASICISDETVAEKDILDTLHNLVQKMSSDRNPGPVHLNCQIREPLYASIETREWCLEQVTSWEASSKTCLNVTSQEADLSAEMDLSGEGVFLVGDIHPQDAPSVLKLSQSKGIPIIADIQSGLRHHSIPKERLKAVDWIIVFGSRFVSKALLEDIKETTKKQIWVSPFDSVQNPTAKDYMRWNVTIAHAVNVLDSKIKKQESLHVKKAPAENSFYEECIQRLSASLNNEVVFIGNSSLIRRCDAAWSSSQSSPQSIFTNRGVSGIDGNLATVAGITESLKRPTVALLGDITVLHDMASLNLLRKSPVPITLIIFNDNGGRIFESLPVAKQTLHLETFFVAPHEINFQNIMKSHDIPFFLHSENQPLENLKSLVQKPVTKCIEIRLYH
jgi:2-succinyl-5-enolpyruvyl-6-hydroxy-3-cyclohexene-1-carboxylate synthase